MHSLNDILVAALRCCNVSKEEWESRKNTRKGTIVRVKQLVSHIATEEGHQARKIAEFLNQDRTTVISQRKALHDSMSVYPCVCRLVEQVIEGLSTIKEVQTHAETEAYIARSRNGLLTISRSHPENCNGFWIAEGTRPFHPQSSFPQVTHDRGPVKVKVHITLNEHETM